jgi:hypothetical protein
MFITVIILVRLEVITADHSGRAVWSMNRLRSLEHWDRWFEFDSSYACLVLCVGSELATGYYRVQGALPTVYRIKKLKKRPRSKEL